MDKVNQVTSGNASLQQTVNQVQQNVQGITSQVATLAQNNKINEQLQVGKKFVMDNVQPNYLVTVGILIIFLIVALIVTREKKDKSQGKGAEKVFQAISGEDVIATKLDLARAYMDMVEVAQAKALLEEVAKKGNAEQKAEAKRLLTELK